MKLWSLIKKWFRKLFCKEKTSDVTPVTPASDVTPVTPAIVESIKEDEDMLRNSIVGAAGSNEEAPSLDFTDYTRNASKSSINYQAFPMQGETLGLHWQELRLRGVSVNPDGTKLYLHNSDLGETYEMTAAGSWDFSSLSVGYTRSQTSEDTSVMQTTPTWSKDGTSYYMVSSQDEPKTIYQYNASTPFSLASASYVGQTNVMNNLTTTSKLGGLLLAGNGSKIYITDENGSNTKTYGATMSTNFSITSSSLISSVAVTFPVDDLSWGVWTHPKGKLILTANRESINSYQLSTAFDFSTAVLQSSLDRESGGTWARGIAASEDLSRVVVFDVDDFEDHFFSVYERL